MEQADVVRVEGLVEGVLGASAVPEESDAVRIPAQLPDILPYPSQRHLLVQQAAVAAHPIAVDDVQVPECTDAVRDRDDDDALLGQVRAVVDRQRPGAAVPAVDEHEDGLGCAGPGCPDIDPQGVLAHHVVARLPFRAQLEVTQSDVDGPGHEALREAVAQAGVDRGLSGRSADGDGGAESPGPRVGDAEDSHHGGPGPRASHLLRGEASQGGAKDHERSPVRGSSGEVPGAGGALGD